MNIDWQDPPPEATDERAQLRAWLDELATRPGSWAKYPTRQSGGWCAVVMRSRPGLDCQRHNKTGGGSSVPKYDVFFRWQP